MAFDITYRLQDLLLAITRGGITERQVAELNRLCQRIALTFIRRKISIGKVNPSFLGLSDRDISLDCVAELFSPSPDGKFSEFIDYFEDQGIDLENTSDRLLLEHLRRLIFYICSDGIFRMYGEADPSLTKIIRNIKLGLKRSDSMVTATLFDEQLVVPRCGTVENSLPVMPYEEMRRLVDASFDPRSGIPELLRTISLGLLDQSEFRKVLPLTDLAFCIRERFSRQNTGDPGTPDDPMFAEDIRTIIRDACSHIGGRAGSRYLCSGKVDPATMQAYMAGVRELLEAEYLGLTEGPAHQYDFFRSALPGISREEYTCLHKPIFEYLVKLVRKRASEDLREL